MQELTAALLGEHHPVRLITRSSALWERALAAADSLRSRSLLQAILHGSEKKISKIEEKIEQKIILAECIIDLSTRKDLGLIFFLGEAFYRVETLNTLLETIVQMQEGKMDKVPILIFGQLPRDFNDFFFHKTGSPLRLEDLPFLHVAETVKDALSTLGLRHQMT